MWSGNKNLRKLFVARLVSLIRNVARLTQKFRSLSLTLFLTRYRSLSLSLPCLIMNKSTLSKKRTLGNVGYCILVKPTSTCIFAENRPIALHNMPNLNDPIYDTDFYIRKARIRIQAYSCLPCPKNRTIANDNKPTCHCLHDNYFL